MPDCEKDRDLNQVSWKQEHLCNPASRKNRVGHMSRSQGDGNTFRNRRVTWILHSDTVDISGHPHPAWQVPAPLLQWGCLGSLHHHSAIIPVPAFPSLCLLISRRESDGQGVIVMLLGSPSLSPTASWPLDGL